MQLMIYYLHQWLVKYSFYDNFIYEPYKQFNDVIFYIILFVKIFSLYIIQQYNKRINRELSKFKEISNYFNNKLFLGIKRKYKSVQVFWRLIL